MLHSWSEERRKSNERKSKAYFLAGYIYAQSERIVQEGSYPRMTDKEFRVEVQRVQKILIYGLVEEEANKKSNVWRDALCKQYP